MPIEKIIAFHEEFPIASIEIGERFRKDYGDLNELRDSILEHGVIQPVVIDAENRLIAGGRRVAASKLAEASTIPAIAVVLVGAASAREIELYENLHRQSLHWSEACALEADIYGLRLAEDPDWSQRRQEKLTGTAKSVVNRRLQAATYLAIDPKLAECENESQMLKRVRHMIQQEGVNKRAAELEETHFTSSGPHPEMRDPADLSKEIKMWWAGEAYMLGDALEKLEKVRANTYHFAEVDPPYAVSLHDKKQRTQDTTLLEEYSEIDAAVYPAFLERAAAATYRALRADTFCIWWYGPEWYETVAEMLQAAGFSINPIPAMWYKGPVGQTTNPSVNLANSYEPFLVARKGSPILFREGRSNVFEFSGVPPSERIHTTQRPLALIEEILTVFCPPNGWLVSPFLGSGTTLISAFLSGRRGIGWDLSEDLRNRFLHRASKYELTVEAVPEETSDAD